MSISAVFIQNNNPAIFCLIRCHNKKAKAKGTFEALISQEWRDDCPKPWLSETVPGTCINMMACRAFKYLNFFNISHWVPNVEVGASGRNTLGEDGTRGWTSTGALRQGALAQP